MQVLSSDKETLGLSCFSAMQVLSSSMETPLLSCCVRQAHAWPRVPTARTGMSEPPLQTTTDF
eukprot:361838-Chlamydomonas_euryale.AAC.3